MNRIDAGLWGRGRFFGFIAYEANAYSWKDIQNNQNNQNGNNGWAGQYRCAWRGNHGGMLPFLGHLVRAVLVLVWISYQRNCACRVHKCTMQYIIWCR